MNVIATANTIAASTRFLRPTVPDTLTALILADREARVQEGPPECSDQRGEALVDEPDGHRALPHPRGDPLDRAGAHVAHGEDPGAARLEEEGLAAVGGQVLPMHVVAGEQEGVIVHGH